MVRRLVRIVIRIRIVFSYVSTIVLDFNSFSLFAGSSVIIIISTDQS